MNKTKMDDLLPTLKYFGTNVIMPQVFSANMHVLVPNFMLSPITPKKKKKNHRAYKKHPMDINTHQILANFVPPIPALGLLVAVWRLGRWILQS
jgi:hypothetical protein